jgi:lipoprotein NlpD
MRAAFYRSTVAIIAAAFLMIGGCLALVGCGRSEVREASATGSITTGSINSGHTSIIVERGETLYGIARRHNVTVYDLMMINNLASPSISAGQRLNLPPY